MTLIFLIKVGACMHNHAREKHARAHIHVGYYHHRRNTSVDTTMFARKLTGRKAQLRFERKKNFHQQDTVHNSLHNINIQLQEKGKPFCVQIRSPCLCWVSQSIRSPCLCSVSQSNLHFQTWRSASAVNCGLETALQVIPVWKHPRWFWCVHNIPGTPIA